MPVIKKCALCNKEFSCKPSHAPRRVYCSKVCASEHYKTRMTGSGNPHFKPQNSYVYNCAFCGVEFKSYQKLPKYCSRSCKAKDVPVDELRRRAALGGAAKKQSTEPKTQKELKQPKPKGTKNICRVCGTEFRSPKKRRYCDDHQHLNPKRDMSKKCVVCGNAFKPKPRRPRKTCSDECFTRLRSERQKGELSHRWQGGKTEKTRSIRNSLEYSVWRSAVFARDLYTCQMCGSSSVKLAAHHIIPFSENENLRTEVTNGITLCWPCHRQIKGREHEYEDRFFEYTKDGSKPPSGRNLTDDEIKWHKKANCYAPVWIIYDEIGALWVCGKTNEIPKLKPIRVVE